MAALEDETVAAFASRACPGDDGITRCSQDRRNGGAYAGPRWECTAMAEFLRGRPWRDLRAVDLRLHGQATALSTVPAYRWLLPAYLLGTLRDRSARDVCADGLAYAFGPPEDDGFGRGRLQEILPTLTTSELAVVLAFFRRIGDRRTDFLGFVGRPVEDLERALASRGQPPGSARPSPTAWQGTGGDRPCAGGRAGPGWAA